MTETTESPMQNARAAEPRTELPLSGYYGGKPTRFVIDYDDLSSTNIGNADGSVDRIVERLKALETRNTPGHHPRPTPDPSYEALKEDAAMFARDAEAWRKKAFELASPEADGLREDLDQLIRVCLTNPADVRGFVAANYPKEYKRYAGTAVPAQDTATLSPLECEPASSRPQWEGKSVDSSAAGCNPAPFGSVGASPTLPTTSAAAMPESIRSLNGRTPDARCDDAGQSRPQPPSPQNGRSENQGDESVLIGGDSRTMEQEPRPQSPSPLDELSPEELYAIERWGYGSAAHCSATQRKMQKWAIDLLAEQAAKLRAVTRFEVIDTTGRRIVYYGTVEPSFQDDGRTLKVFVPTELRLPERESGWQDIATAPRGEVVLVHCDDGRITRAVFRREKLVEKPPFGGLAEWGGDTVKEGWFELCDFYSDYPDAYLDEEDCRPTHWMALPESPRGGHE